MFVWDSLFVILVVLPALTGGAWWQAPHFHVEYTEPGAAAAVLAAWLWYRGGVESSRVCQAGAALWLRWTRALAARPALSLGLAWIAASAIWFTTSLLRHRALGSGLADLGIFTNAISNVSELGFPMSSLKNGLSLLSDHQIFWLYPLGWIFPLWPSPVFLLLLQALVLSSGGVALYLLGRQRLGPAHPAVPWLPFLFWLAGPIRAANRFDFHPETFMLPLFLFGAYFLQERGWVKRAAGALLLLGALAAKESAGPVACGIGLAWLLGAGPVPTRRFTRVCGSALMLLGLGAFVFDQRIVPSLFGVGYAYSDLYAPLPPTAGGLLLAPFTQPLVFFGRLFSLSRLKFLLGALLPAAFLPLLTPAAVAALPGFLMLFLTSGDHRVSLGYHYAIEPLTGLLFALPAALASRFARSRERMLLPALLVAAALSFGHSEAFFWRIYQASPHQAWVRDEILPRVPRERSVTASYAFVPQLAARRWIDQPGSSTYTFRGETRAYDCVLLDPNVNNTPMSNVDVASFAIGTKALGYVEEARCGSFLLLRGRNVASCLSSPPPPCPEAP